MSDPQLYLASSSPRRRELLAQIGVRYALVTQPVEESRLKDQTPEQYVRALALDKARAGRNSLDRHDGPVLGADTIVVVDNEILGKPRDEADALRMWALLSGRQHRVLSAVALVGRDNLGHDRAEVRVSESRVWFRPLTKDECVRYWQTGEPRDKAGGYAVQGLAAVFIERLEGSYSGVMGLPLFETAELLGCFGIEAMPVMEAEPGLSGRQ